MNSMEEIKSVTLNDKREIYLNDNDGISLSIVSDGKTVFELPVEYPSGGYGDGSIYLSPFHSYLLFAYYSGQTEEAFMLFTIGDKLEMIFESDYLYGKEASYGFSEDEKLLLQGLPRMGSEWWLVWTYRETDGETQTDQDGNAFVEFGSINILDIQKEMFCKHTIHIYLSDNWQPPEEDYDPWLKPEITGDGVLQISMPWGNERLNLPPEDVIRYEL